jgi:hypothetical protein
VALASSRIVWRYVTGLLLQEYFDLIAPQDREARRVGRPLREHTTRQFFSLPDGCRFVSQYLNPKPSRLIQCGHSPEINKQFHITLLAAQIFIQKN